MSCVSLALARRVGAPCRAWGSRCAVVSVRSPCVCPSVRRAVRRFVAVSCVVGIGAIVGSSPCLPCVSCAVSVRSLSLRVRLPASPCRACAPVVFVVRRRLPSCRASRRA